MLESLPEFPLKIVSIIAYLSGLGLLVYGISVIKQLITDWWFISKNKIFFERELREREMAENIDKWLDEWKRKSYKYDDFAWDYNYTKKGYPKTKKDFLNWLLLVLLYIIILLITLR